MNYLIGLFLLASTAAYAADPTPASSGKPPVATFDRCGASVAILRQQREGASDSAAAAGAAVMEARAEAEAVKHNLEERSVRADNLQKQVDDLTARMASLQKQLDEAKAAASAAQTKGQP